MVTNQDLSTASGDEARPDGRTPSPETIRLRMATRALRYHLDTLPLEIDPNSTGEQFLTTLAIMSARHRYDCADSMIGASFGGTVLGSIARSVFIDGLRWLWIARQPERQRFLLGDLLEERNRLCILLEQTGASCPIMARWFMPVPDVADLSGESLSWLDVSSIPTEDELLDDFLNRSDSSELSPRRASEHATLLRRARGLLDIAGLRGAVMILAHAGHGNHLGMQSSLTDDGGAGYDLRADHEALFMQVAAVGVTATMLGAAAVAPQLLASDHERDPVLRRAVDLAEEVTTAAAPIHRLGAARRSTTQTKKRNGPPRKATLLRPSAILTADDLLPDINTADLVAAAAVEYYELAGSVLIRPWDYGDTSLHSMLTYGGGHSHLQTVMETYDQPGSAVIAVFAARMLLEESARMVWRYSLREEDAFKSRAKQFFDEFRARERKTVDTLTGSGVARTDAVRIFARPDNVLMVTPNDEIAKGRSPIPSIGKMLREMGSPYPEPGWLEVAYSLLSQVTHSTPIGLMHTARYQDGAWRGNEISPEMLGLALDVACMGSAHLIGLSAAVITNASTRAMKYRNDLQQQAYAVHNVARMVHGLD